MKNNEAQQIKPPAYYRALPLDGRATFEATCSVVVDRSGSASRGDENVTFVAERDPAKTTISIRVHGDTEITMPLDTLLNAVTTLCPPWLLRSKLGK